MPAARDTMSEEDNADDCARDIQRHLHYVGPDDGGHSAFEGVDQRQNANDGDGDYIPGTDSNANDDGNGKDTDSFRGCTQEEKQKCGEFVQPRTKSLANDFVCGEQFTAKIAGQKNDADHDPAQKVAENDLEESPVSGVREAGHADDGQGTGFRGYDGEGDRPPGDFPVREKVVL